MKTLICGILIVLTSMCVFGQARPGVYPWSITLKIVDDLGQPVSAAKVDVGYMQTQQTEGLTDSNGVFVASHTDKSLALGFLVKKEGYYSDRFHYTLYLPGQFDDQKVAANRNAVLTLTLKKIIKPIAMYAKHIESGPPVFNKPVGYDLTVGDWVGPYGKGINTDIIFDGEMDQKAKDDFDYKLIVSFPKQDDGIQSFSVPMDDLHSQIGELHSMQEAPTNGYDSSVIRTMSRHPGQGTKEDIYNSNRNYYFRVRTKVDDRGNIVSTHYGKIYGDFMNFNYYLNPTPNSRDVEFDPKQNLIKNLGEFEGVNEP
jgi:hypothetical protein